MPIEPLARAGAEEAVGKIFATLLCQLNPEPELLMLDGLRQHSIWPPLLREAWPGQKAPWVHTDFSRISPTLSLDNRTFPEWLSSRSRNFRQQMARGRRKLERSGAAYRLVPQDELDDALSGFASLHRSRWSRRGGSSVLSPGVESMLHDAARQMAGRGHFRLWSIEVDGRPISSHIFVAAGGLVSYWLGGFDEAWSSLHPSLQAILAAIEHASSVGDKIVDLGPGAQQYKYRFANGETTLDWVTIVPPGPHYSRTRLHLLPKNLYRAVGSRIPDATKDRLKKIMGETPRWAQ